MFRKTVTGLLTLPLFAAPLLTAQDATLVGLQGRVIVNNRPVDTVVEVRLDSETGGRTISTAYTLEGDEFAFGAVRVNSNDSYFIVIDHPGFKEARVRLDQRNFFRAFNNPSQLVYGGILVFYLEPDDPEKEEEPDQPDGPRSLDVRVLTAEIPDAAREEYERSLGELEAGNSREAVRHLEAAIDMAPDYYDALNKLGIEYVKLDQYREAELVLERAGGLNPNDPRPRINLGMLHLQEGQVIEAGGEPEAARGSYLKAVDVLEEAARLDPLVAESSFYLGSALYETGQLRRAEFFLTEALSIDGQLHDARLVLLNVYTRQRRWEEALGMVTTYLDAVPDSPRRQALDAVRLQLEAVLQLP